MALMRGMQLKVCLISLSASLALVSGCTSSATDLAATRRAIIDGVKSGPDDDAAIGIGIFGDNGGFQGACSGVLIAPNLVLSARHCVSEVENAGIACSSDGTPIFGGGVLGDHQPGNMRILLGSELSLDFAANGAQLITLEGDDGNLCDSDIALLLLDRNIPSAPIAQIRLDTPPTTDETIRAVGWGTANNTNSNLPSRRKRDDIPIVLVGPDDFTGLGAHEFMIGEGICSGDSGGPAFVETTRAVIGVVSRGGNGKPYDPSKDPPYTQCVDSGQFVTQNTYTRTDAYKDFILGGFAIAGNDPWVEGGPDPRKAKFGESCTTDDECRSAICLQPTGKAPMCTDACTKDTPCADGFSCQNIDGRQLCAEKKKGGCSAASSSPAEGAASLALFALGLLLLRRRRLA